MKKGFLFLLTVFMMLSVGIKAQTVVLSESFENGIPATWTQENVVGEQNWTVESDGVYPDGAYSGTKRAVLRNGTEQTIGYKTRLVTPVMDLSKVYQPILRFAYASARWTADFDTLCVYYRKDSKDEWHEIKKYTSYQNEWTTDMLVLPGVNDSYQLAFEGSDNLGRGIVLDSILVRSMPECTVPHDLYVMNMVSGSATLGWQASLDANYFQIVLTTIEINPDTLEQVASENITMNYDMEADSTTYRVQNLVPGQNYWLYVRSLCDKENSDWGSYAFRMNATAQIPYEEDFNGFAYTAGKVSRMPAWTYGGTSGKPFIPTNAPSVTGYSYSGYCLAFAEQNDYGKNIPSRYISYAVTPELVGEDLKNCQVRFLATVADATGLRKYASGIIVGVVTEPDDISTFVAIDTCYVWDRGFEEKVVNFSQYAGNGHYIAFLSDFSMPNRIFIDNLKVYASRSHAMVKELNIAPKDTEVTLSWDMVEGATGYNVAITSSPVETPVEMVAHQENVTGTSCTLTGLEAGKLWNAPYYAYIQTVYADGTSDWSFRKAFTTTTSCTLPSTFSLEIVDGRFYTMNGVATNMYPKEVGLYSNSMIEKLMYPCITNTNPHGGGNASMMFEKGHGEDAWIVLPRLANSDLKTAQITFYMQVPAANKESAVAVGVMTNPMDINTFELVSECHGGIDMYSRVQVNFADYKGAGEYVAIVWLDSPNKSRTIAYIDDITIAQMGNCAAPIGLEALTSTNSATLKWAQGGKEKWQVVVTNRYITDDGMANLDVTKPNDNIVKVAEVSNKPEYEFTELPSATKYYFYVRAICGGDYSDWSSGMTFTTNCLPIQPTPYEDNFESYGSGKGSFPTCWYNDYDWSYDFDGYLYQYLNTTQNHTAGVVGGSALYFGGNMGPNANPKGYAHIVAPKLDIPVKDVRLKFYYYSGTASGKLYIGTQTDPADYETFHIWDSVMTITTATWQDVSIDFTSYTGNDEYIAFSNKLSDPNVVGNHFYIDDITFASAACAAPVNIRTTASSETSMTIAWDGKTNDKWKVVVSKTAATYGEGGELIGATPVFEGETTDNSIFVDQLSLATTYYVYVRATCGMMEWGSATASTECTKINPRMKNKEGFDKLGNSTTAYGTAKQFSDFCWTSGTMNASAASTFWPFVYKTTTATYATSQPNCGRLYCSTSATTTGPVWACSPEIDIDDMSKLIVSFKGYCSSSYAFLFGVMSDPNDPLTFVVLDSITGSGASKLYLFEMSQYAGKMGDAKHIALRTPYGGKACTLYFDDFSAVVNSCPNPNPSTSGVTSNSIRVSSGMRESSPWRLIVTDKALNTDSLESSTYSIPSTVNILLDTIFASNVRSYVLTGLEEQTTYYCSLAGVCDSTTSMYHNISFTTLCNPIAVDDFPSISFETAEGYATGTAAKSFQCWLTGNKNSTSTSYLPNIKTDANYPHYGKNYLYLYSTSTYNGCYATMPALDVDDIRKVQLHFYAHATTSTANAHSIIVGVVTDPYDMATFVGLDTIDVGADIEYRPYTVYFNEYEGDYMGGEGKHICFLSEFEISNTIYIDDVSIGWAPACLAPKGVHMVDMNQDSVTVAWRGTSDRYHVLVARDKANDGSQPVGIMEMDVTTNSVGIKGLQGGTQYYVYVQGQCDGSASPYSEIPAIIDMPCTAVYPVPYTCDFDHNSAYGNGVLPDCWNGAYVGDVVATYPSVVANGGNPNGALKLYSSSGKQTYTIAALPALDAADLSDYALSLHACKTDSKSGSSIVLGYVGQMVSDLSRSFVALDTLTVPSTSYRRIYVSLEAWKNELAGQNLALKVDARVDLASTSSIMIDNVKVEKVATCIAPDLSNINPSKTSVTCTIEPVIGQSKWEVCILPYTDNFTASDIDNGTIMTLTSTSVQIDNLTPGTRYRMFVRTICSDTDKSAWDDMNYNFYTISDYTNGWFFGFEKEEGWTRSPLSESDSYYMHPSLVSGVTPIQAMLGVVPPSSYDRYAYAHENDFYNYSLTGKGALCLSTSEKQQGASVIFPAITTTEARAFSFDVRPGFANEKNNRMALTGSNNTFRIGTVEEGKGMETFEQLGIITLPTLNPRAEINEQNNYLFEHYVINFPAGKLAGRQIALIDRCQDATVIHIDNAKLDTAEAYSTPLMSHFFAAGDYVDIEFVSNDVMTIYIVPGVVSQLDKTAANVLKFENIQSKCHLTGTEPQKTYTIFIEANNVPDGLKTVTSVSRTFTTHCAAFPLDEDKKFVCTFDDPDTESFRMTDGMFYAPSCWQLGNFNVAGTNTWTIMHLGEEVSRAFPPTKGANPTVPGRSNSSALAFVVSGMLKAAVGAPYAVMPLVDCDYDDYQLTFYMRNVIHNASTGKTISLAARAADFKVGVGYCTDPSDMSTYVGIDTINYPYTVAANTLIESDPRGMEFWHKVSLPLSAAKGGFITFSYISEQGGICIDDVTFEPLSQLFAPKGLSVYGISTNEFTVRWSTSWHPNLPSVVRLYSNDRVTVIRQDTIAAGEQSYRVTDLQPNTEYFVTVYQYNDEMVSAESEMVSGYTECQSIDATYTCSFENGEGISRMISGQTDPLIRQAQCWTYGNAGTETSFTAGDMYDGWPYNYYPDIWCASRTGNNSLRLVAKKNGAQIGYAATPRLDNVDMDTLQIELWAIPTLRNTSSGAMITTTAGQLYSKSFEVGTCSDPNDVSTFKPIRTCVYTNTIVADEIAGAPDYKFQHFSVPLIDAAGPYVYIMATTTDDEGNTYNNGSIMYIDDISFSRYSVCEQVEQFDQTDRTINSVDMEWLSNVPTTIVQLSKTAMYEAKDIIYCDTLTSDDRVYSIHYDGLEPHTTYYARVRAMCGVGDVSTWSATLKVTTTITPYWSEDFRNATPADTWNYGTVCASDMFADQSGELKLKGDNQVTYGWVRDTKGAGIPGAHMHSLFYSSNAISTYENYWMVTPTIYIDPIIGNAHLTWDMALTAAKSSLDISSEKVDVSAINPSCVFMVVISEDGGKTWKRENATVWSEGNTYGAADYTMTSISNVATNYELDLSKYAGKSIQVAFYREAKGEVPVQCCVHIGDVRVNYYVNNISEQTRCRYEDAVAFGMRISGDNAEGDVTVKRIVPVTELDILSNPNAMDTCYMLVAHYLPMPQENYSATICEGRTFTDYGFRPVDKSGKYTRKLIAANGCDSIVTLDLTQTPTSRYVEEINLCPGETYNWNGKTLNRAGMYNDTLTSSATGCDSISSVILTYFNLGDTLRKDVRITEDDLPYSFESITYPVGTKPGVYTDTIYVEASTCKAVMIHVLTIDKGTGMESILSDDVLMQGVHKLIINERLYIVRDGEWYDSLGKLVDRPM